MNKPSRVSLSPISIVSSLPLGCPLPAVSREARARTPRRFKRRARTVPFDPSRESKRPPHRLPENVSQPNDKGGKHVISKNNKLMKTRRTKRALTSSSYNREHFRLIKVCRSAIHRPLQSKACCCNPSYQI